MKGVTQNASRSAMLCSFCETQPVCEVRQGAMVWPQVYPDLANSVHFFANLQSAASASSRAALVLQEHQGAP